MKFYAYHGVLEQERRVGNTFVVDLTLMAPLEKAVQSDQLEDTINYAEVYELTKQEMNIHSKIIKKKEGRICRALRHHFPQIEQIEIRVSKLNPPFGGDVHSASVLLID